MKKRKQKLEVEEEEARRDVVFGRDSREVEETDTMILLNQKRLFPRKRFAVKQQRTRPARKRFAVTNLDDSDLRGRDSL